MSYSMKLFMDGLSLEFINVRTFEFAGPYNLFARNISPEVFWFIEEGELTLALHRQQIRCGPGDFIHLPLHCSPSWTTASRTLRYRSIRFRAAWQFPHDRAWSDRLGLPTVIRSEDHDFAPTVARIVELFDRSAEEYKPGNRLLLEGAFLSLIGSLLNHPRVSQGFRSADPGQYDSRIEAIVEYLATHPHRMPKLGELEAMCSLSPSHLRTLFRRNTGMPPIQFIHRLKIRQAMRLLETSGRPVADIASSLGYAQVNYFSRIFKKITGEIPVEYRKKSREV